ncbi:MAG: MmgE/PrpD family protein [Betaproteobacteria bacterium]|nr:MmgE/PrpD family protein [Betaproteobacteria bacterium]
MNTEQTDSNPYTRCLASFIAGLRYERIPAEVVSRVKLLILDSLGCGIFGSVPRHSRILLDTLARLDRSTECGVWGTSQRLSAPHAALVNGSMIQGFELDDAHARGSVHTGSGSLPALIAAAEIRPGMTGKAFIASAVAAFETAPRVGLCMGQGFAGRGWHSGVLAAFSGAAATAAALRLTPEQTVHALGIAGTQAAGLMAAQYGAMVKRMHAGRGAQSGLYAAFLAEAGYTGIENLFESEYGGFCTTFSGSRDEFDLEELRKGLGRDFETMRTSLKFYASAASTHTALDAIRALRSRRPFQPQDVERIVVHASRRVVEHVGWRYEPVGLTSAQMNLPFCAATLLLEGDVFIDQFTETAVHDPARIALARKVEVREDPVVTAKGRDARYEVRVQARLRDGATLEESMSSARGSEKQFATEADVVAKFAKLASRVLPARQAEALRDVILGLDAQPDVSALTSLLTLG